SGAKSLGNSNSAILPSDRIFGDLLRELRRAAGLTQAELAELANLSPRGLSDVERGINRHPRRETLLALAGAVALVGEEREGFFQAARRRTPADIPPDVPLQHARIPRGEPEAAERITQVALQMPVRVIQVLPEEASELVPLPVAEIAPSTLEDAPLA